MLVSWPKITQLANIPFTTFVTMPFVNSLPSSLDFGVVDLPYMTGYTF